MENLLPQLTNGLQVLAEVSARRPLKLYVNQCALQICFQLLGFQIGDLKSKKRDLKVSFKLEPPSLRQQWLPEISQTSESRRYIVHPEVVDAEPLFDFGPLDGSGYAGLRPRPHRVNRSERPSPGILVIVNQYPALRPFRNHVNCGD